MPEQIITPMKYAALILVFTCMACLSGNAQAVVIGKPQVRLAAPSPVFLPEYARQNPAGHSFLCRIEAKQEKYSPAPVWIKLGPAHPAETYLVQQGAVRLRLLRLSK